MKSSSNAVFGYYNKVLVQDGAQDHMKVGWGSVSSQELRFSVLSEVGFFKGCSVLDVGCGLGNLFDWLITSGISIDYHGIDINLAIIDEARRLRPQVRFDVLDILDPDHNLSRYDFVVLSGALTIPVNHQDIFINKMMSRMFELCKLGVAANFMSTHANHIEPGKYYANPSAMTEVCLSLTRKFVLRHDYMTHDMTVYLYP